MAPCYVPVGDRIAAWLSGTTNQMSRECHGRQWEDVRTVPSSPAVGGLQSLPGREHNLVDWLAMDDDDLNFDPPSVDVSLRAAKL